MSIKNRSLSAPRRIAGLLAAGLMLLSANNAHAQATGIWYQATDLQALSGTTGTTGISGCNSGTISVSSQARTGVQGLRFSPASTSAKFIQHNNIGVFPAATTGYVHILYWAKSQVNAATSTAVIRYCANTSTTGPGSSSSTLPGTAVTLNNTSWTRVTGYTAVNNSVRYYWAAPSVTVSPAADSVVFDDFVMYYSADVTDDITKPGAPSALALGGSNNVSWTNGTDGGTNPTGTQGAIILTTTNPSATAPVLLDQGYYPAAATFNADWTVVTNTTGTTATFGAGVAQVAVVNYDKAYNFSTATLISTSTPTIVATPGTLNFGAVAMGGTSAAQWYNITGSNLSTDITVAPPADFQVSPDSLVWTSNPATMTLTQTGGAVSARVYVRFAPGVATGVLNEQITSTSTGASNNNVSVSGTAIAARPTLAGTITTSNAAATTADVTLPTNGNGANRIIVVKAGGAPTAPSNGVAYTANASYGNAGVGTTTATGSYVIYNGNGGGNASPVVTVNNLVPNTTYTFAVYEFNGSATTTNYLTSGAGTATATTVDGTLANDYFSATGSGNWNAPATWQSSHDGISYITATAAPDSNAAQITIPGGATVTVTAAASGDAMSIATTGSLTVNAGASFIVANGASATDLSVDGNIRNAGSFIVTTGAAVVMNATAVYEDAQAATTGAITVPTATWNIASTFKLTGLVGVASTDYTTLTNIKQHFGNFIIDLPNFLGKLVLGFNGALTTPFLSIDGNLTINATGSGGGVQFTSTNKQNVVIIGGNYTQNGGNTAIIAGASSAANRGFTCNNFTLNNNSVFEVMNSSNGATSGNTTTLNVLGNVAINPGATLQRTTTNGNAVLSFGGTGLQTYTNNGTVTGLLNVSVPATATVDLNTSNFQYCYRYLQPCCGRNPLHIEPERPRRQPDDDWINYPGCRRQLRVQWQRCPVYRNLAVDRKQSYYKQCSRCEPEPVTDGQWHCNADSRQPGTRQQ